MLQLFLLLAYFLVSLLAFLEDLLHLLCQLSVLLGELTVFLRRELACFHKLCRLGHVDWLLLDDRSEIGFQERAHLNLYEDELLLVNSLLKLPQ